MAITPRTDPEQVKGVLLDTYNGSANLSPFMRGAKIITDAMIRCAQKKGITHTDDEIIEIETWLAAHGYAMSDQVAESERDLNANVTYQGKTDMALNATKFGQHALSLDYSGCLNAIGKHRKQSILWLGKDPSAQINVWDRQ